MARNRRIESDSAANYHIVSRCNNRSFLFSDGKLKDRLADILVRTAAFSGVEIKASCLMDNHFHIVVHVPKPEEELAMDEIIRRISILKGPAAADILRKRWAGLGEGALESRLDGWRKRMHNLHEFVKTFKELVNIAYKDETGHKDRTGHKDGTGHTGTLFEGRYHSTLIEDGRYLAACIRYVEYNPIRAGIVRRAEEYRWSTKNASKANENSPHAGSVPEGGEWVRRRVRQMSQGVIFGSAAFVRKATMSFGACFAAKSVVARPVTGVGGSGDVCGCGNVGGRVNACGCGDACGGLLVDAYASHGYRLVGAA